MGERYGIDGLKWWGKCFIIKKNELDFSIYFRNLRKILQCGDSRKEVKR